MQQRLDHKPGMMRVRRQTVKHPFGTLKFWMGAARFLMKTREHVSTEMSLHVLAYNLRRVMTILGTKAMMSRFLPTDSVGGRAADVVRIPGAHVVLPLSLLQVDG